MIYHEKNWWKSTMKLQKLTNCLVNNKVLFDFIYVQVKRQDRRDTNKKKRN